MKERGEETVLIVWNRKRQSERKDGNISNTEEESADIRGRPRTEGARKRIRGRGHRSWIVLKRRIACLPGESHASE